MINETNFTSDAVIRRGYDLYDAWESEALSSRIIVYIAERAAQALKRRRSRAASAEALACLFALDLRQKEKYGNILWRILFFRSRRRELGAISLLRSAFGFPASEEDVRGLIEMEIMRQNAQLDDDFAEESDEDEGGGRNNEKSEAEAEQSGREQAAEENTEELADAEEAEQSAEKMDETVSEEEMAEEATEERDERAKTDEPTEEAEEASQDGEEVDREQDEKLNEENNGPDGESEPGIDTKKEAATYNDAIDSTPLYANQVSEGAATEPISFIDEVIMDNMVKGKDDFVTHNPLGDVRPEREAQGATDAAAAQDELTSRSDKNDYLYDEMVQNEKDGATGSTDKEVRPEEKSEAKPEEKPDIKGDTAQSEQKSEELRDPKDLEITAAEENEMRGDLNGDFTDEEVLAFKQALSEVAREHMEVASEAYLREQLSVDGTDIGIDTPTETIENKNTPSIQQQSTVSNKK